MRKCLVLRHADKQAVPGSTDVVEHGLSRPLWIPVLERHNHASRVPL